MSKNKANRADLARQAIEYLTGHDFVLAWDFSATEPPPEGIRKLLAPYFADGEIELTTSGLLCDYLVSRLARGLPVDGRPEPVGSRLRLGVSCGLRRRRLSCMEGGTCLY